MGGKQVVELPRWQCWRRETCMFDPWLGKIPWRRAWQPAPAFLPGESHGQRSPVGYTPWGHRGSDTTEHTHTHTHTQATRHVLKRAVSKVTWGWIRNPGLLWISVAPRLARTCPAGWTCHFPPGISSSRQITGLSSTVPSLPSCSDCPVPSHRHGGQSTHLQ